MAAAGMHESAKIFLGLAAVMLLVSADAVSASDSAMESALVTIERLSGRVPGMDIGGRVSIEILVGKRRLFQTDWRTPGDAEFGNRITFKTAKSMPIRFIVSNWIPKRAPGEHVKSPVASGARPPTFREGPAMQDDVLATGFDGLIGDYKVDGGVPAADQASQRISEGKSRDSGASSHDERPNGRQSVLCEAQIDWPPANGIHRIDCGGASLEISTVMLKRAKSRPEAR